MADNIIEFKNVTKTYKLFKNDKKRLLSVFNKRVKYKEKQAVNDVSFTIKRGEAVALLGKNGAGKSTILKIVTGVTFPTKGEVKVNGRVSALLELTAGFDQEMTGRENIYLKGQIMGLKDSDIRELEETIVDFAELGDYIDQPVRTYSSGMKARLGFAINVNIEPEILIIDEALSVGDAQFKKKCRKRVNEVMQSDNITLLFVTHASGVAKEFCERGLVMKNGKLIFDSDIDSAVKKYEDMIK
ncbi:MAG: ABC transporter ATP-binding protein [Firmicutes bacterium]|nr:ABC transporter ATP-binding protein [Bacillota bacterium]